MSRTARFDLSDVSVDDDYSETHAGLPKKGSLFRIHPQSRLKCYVLYHQPKWYLLKGKEVIDAVKAASYLRNVYRAEIFHGIDSREDNFAAVVSLPGNGSSYLSAMADAMDHWVERLNNENEVIFEDRLDCDKEPKWSLSFLDMLNQAFHGRVICDPEDPLLKGKIHGKSKA